MTLYIYIYVHTPYSGKLSREKTFTNNAVLWLSANFFFTKFGGVASFDKASNLQNFLHENRIFHQFAKVFLPRKFPAIRYIVLFLNVCVRYVTIVNYVMQERIRTGD